jgi:hypothetical protein
VGSFDAHAVLDEHNGREWGNERRDCERVVEQVGEAFGGDDDMVPAGGRGFGCRGGDGGEAAGGVEGVGSEGVGEEFDAGGGDCAVVGAADQGDGNGEGGAVEAGAVEAADGAGADDEDVERSGEGLVGEGEEDGLPFGSGHGGLEGAEWVN